MRETSLTLAVVLFAGACSGGPAAEPDPTTTTAEAATTTTVAATTTTADVTTTTVERTALDRLGYPVSDAWRVETVVRDIDANTGGLAIADDGTMYQADFGGGDSPGDRLLRILPNGTVETFVQDDRMENLTMTVFAPDGTILQSSYGSNTVFSIDLDGTVDVVAEGIAGPTGIVAREDGTLFIEGYNARRVFRVVEGVTEDLPRHPDFNGPNGIAEGPDGTLYVVNHRDGGLFAMPPDGGEVTKLHAFPRETSHAAYLDGSLFVTGRTSCVIYRYDLETGDVEVVAGDAECGDNDGVGGSASFGRPNAITVGPDGYLYFNHGSATTNNPVTIRRLVPAG